MAEDSDLEKTEPASQRKLEQARENGDVPRSRELSTCTSLLAAAAGFWLSGENMVHQTRVMLASGMSMTRAEIFDPSLLVGRLAANFFLVATAFAPPAMIMLLVAVSSPMLIGGWLFSSKSLIPDFARLNPVSGLSKMVSSNALVEIAKAIAKTLIVAAIAYLVVTQQVTSFFSLSNEPIARSSTHAGHILLSTFIALVGGLVLIALIDVPYQLWHYSQKMKMTLQEVRQEAKESDGNPEIKAKIRAQQRAMAQRRMMADVPLADVIVTNPTHYAVALRYSDGVTGAPRVVAKGADNMAARIRDIAIEHHVTILESPPLARALHQHAEIGDEIPEALYGAVAEVLAYVYQLRTHREQGRGKPLAPSAIAVPKGFDPLDPIAPLHNTEGPKP